MSPWVLVGIAEMGAGGRGGGGGGGDSTCCVLLAESISLLDLELSMHGSSGLILHVVGWEPIPSTTLSIGCLSWDDDEGCSQV